MAKHNRIQLELSKQSLKRFNILVEETGCTTKIEFLRKVLAVFDALHEAKKNGSEIIIKHPDGKEYCLLSLF